MSDKPSYRLQKLRGLVDGDYMLLPFEDYQALIDKIERLESKGISAMEYDIKELTRELVEEYKARLIAESKVKALEHKLAAWEAQSSIGEKKDD